MTPVRIHARREEGSALVVSFAILLTVLIFSAATWQAAIVLTGRSNKETDAQKAFQAADAGIDTAIHRLSQYAFATASPALTDTNCITTGTSTAPMSPNSSDAKWCKGTTSELVGSSASYTFSTSLPNPTSCVGTARVVNGVSGAADRCVVSTGTVNGTQRRLQARVTVIGGAGYAPLSDGAVKANDSVKVESGVSITYSGSSAQNLGISLNTKIEVSHNSTIGVPVTISKSAKTPKGIASTAYTRATYDPLVATPAPDFGTTAYAYNASTNVGGNNNSTISTAYYTAGTTTGSLPPGTRKLYIPKNKQVTLAPGIYNFCSIQLEGRGILNAAGTAASPVKIYLDSPYRDGSSCPKNTGTITAGGKAAIVNPSLDPTALQIIAWGSTTRKKRARLQVPMGKSGTLAAIIYAPNSEVRFGDNKGLLVGGIVGRRVVFKKNMRFISDSRVTGWTITTIKQTYRDAWRQCDSTLVNPAIPSSGCS